MPRAVIIMCLALAVVSLGLFAASCGNSNAQYRVVNAISNTSLLNGGSLAIYMNGGSVFPTVNFPGTEPGSGKYANVQQGTDSLDVYASGTAGESGDEIIGSALNLNGNTQTTVVLTGNQSTTLAAQKYTDNNTTQPISGNALFRVINASAVTQDVEGVDVYILAAPFTPRTPGAQSLNSSALTFRDADTLPYTNVGLPTSNSLNVFVTAHGQTGDYAPPITVSGLTGHTSIRTIIVVDGNDGTSPPQLLQLTDVN